MLGTCEAVIVDEIHSVAQSKRGSHLALTLERLEHLVKERGAGSEERDLQRIGLSATQRPLDRIARFLVGPKRECEIVDAGKSKDLDLEIQVPVEDMTEPGASSAGGAGMDPAARRPSEHGGVLPATGPAAERIDPGPIEASLDPATNTRSIWPAIYPELLKLVRAHTSTIIFVNARRAPGQAPQRAGDGRGAP
jgi:ATP-dependent Lhr-like helicase